MWEAEVVTEYEILSQSFRERMDGNHEERQLILCPVEIRVILCDVL